MYVPAMAPKTALVVEDDKGISNLLRETLEGEGFQVLCEKDGDWALKALERRLPDILITDILLPSLGGFELLEALRRMPGGGDVPVIAISGIYRGQRHKKQAQDRLGVLAYFDKPFEISALLFAVQEALGAAYPSARARARSQPPRPSKGADVFDDPLADFDQKMERQDVERVESSFNTARTAKGNLKHKRFAEVLAQLYRWRATGALLLRRDKQKKIVYLKEGYPIFVKSNLLSECLGRVLVREKMISDEECERSLLLMKERVGRQQGTVLIEMGCISPHNLVFALQLQLEQKLFDIFAWPDGDFQFNPKIDIPSQTVHLDMSLATIVYEGVRRKVGPRAVDDYLEPFWESYLTLHPDPAYRFQELALEADERTLLALADGRRTSRELVEKSGLKPQHAKQLLYTLLATETMQASAKPARKKDVAAFGETAPSLSRPPPLKKRADAVFSSGRSQVDEVPVDEQRIRLVERARAMKRQNYFEMLGVSRSATLDEITRAYHALVREVHPDRMRKHVPADARALAEQITAQIKIAFETLADDKRKTAYMQKLAQGQKTTVSDEVGKILLAEGRFRKGEQLLKTGLYEKAVEQFREAVELYPEEGEFSAHLGWALFLATPDDPLAQAEAQAQLDKAIALSPRFDRAYLYLGRVLSRSGRSADAQRAFEQALVCNPDSSEALAELRLHIGRGAPRRRGT